MECTSLAEVLLQVMNFGVDEADRRGHMDVYVHTSCICPLSAVANVYGAHQLMVGIIIEVVELQKS